MSSLAQILPFLAALQKQQGITTGPDAGGLSADPSTSVDISGNVSAPSVIARMQQPYQGPPAGDQMPGPPAQPQGPQPDLSIGGNPTYQQPQQPSDPVADIAGSFPTGRDAQPKLAKGTQLLMLLRSGLMGGLAGMEQNAQTYAATGRNAGFGGGLYGAAVQPIQQQRGYLENQQLIQMLPFLRAQQIAGIQQKTSEAQKNLAQAGQATAEAGAIPIKTQLEQAQTQAAFYKDDPNLGLIDIRTGQPVAGNAGTAPLTAQEAAILGKQPGDTVPLKIKNQANEMVNRGIKSVSAGGRQLLVDNQGNTIKDMGQATPMAVINAQMAGPQGGLSPDMQAAASAVAQGKTDLATAIRPFMRFPGMAMAFQAEVYRQNPQYFQGNYANAVKTLENFTSGPVANEINAFNTAIQHADLLRQAAKALNNGNVRALAGFSNQAQSQFGDPDLTNFDAINHVYQNEIQKMIAGNHITNQEISTNGATLPSNANYATIDKVLSSYQALAQSKLANRQKQFEQGMQGKPNFPAQASGPAKFDPSKLPDAH